MRELNIEEEMLVNGGGTWGDSGGCIPRHLDPIIGLETDGLIRFKDGRACVLLPVIPEPINPTA